MIADILTIGRTGLSAATGSLATTSNNIANVNTPGYSRQSTTQVSSPLGGVGEQITDRIVSSFAQYQLRIDTSNVSRDEAFLRYAEYLDNVMSSESNSMSVYLDNFFGSVHTASNSASISAGRQSMLAGAESLVNQFHTLTDVAETQKKQINNELDQLTNRGNELIESISRINREINNGSLAFPGGIPTELYDERDQNILELSELMEVNVIELDDQRVAVNLANGASLVMADGTFNLFSLPGETDPLARELDLIHRPSGTIIGVNEELLGGEIGGLLRVREEIVDKSLRELGQLSLSLGDAFNIQQHLGMDLDNEIGSDMFSFDSTFSVTGADNTGDILDGIEVRMEAGRGNEITANDYVVTIGPGATDYTIQGVDLNGNPVGTPGTGSFVAGVFSSSIDGLELNFNPNGANFTVGDEFVIQPALKSASTMNLELGRWEDIALASPIRTSAESANLGSGSISPGTVNDTDPATSDFTAPGGLTTDPLYIVYSATNTFDIYDGDPNGGGAIIGTAVYGTNQYDDIMATAGLAANGYEFSIDGLPALNDTYTLSYNTDGFHDNRNGNEMLDLQNQDLVRGDINGVANMSFQQRYSSTIADIGVKTSQAQISLIASTAMQDQSYAWNQSVSGVNLDEEAADLIKFQQAYAASAQIITVSQTLFDTILSSVR